MVPAAAFGLLLAFSLSAASDTAAQATRAAMRVGLVVSPDRHAALSAALREAVATVVGSADTGAVELLIRTEPCSAEAGAESARALADAKVALVIGHPCGPAALSAAKLYAAAGIPFVAVGVRHPDLTDRRAGPYVFRLAGRDDRQGADTVAALIPMIAGRRVAVLHDRTRYHRRLADEVVSGLAAKAAAVAVVPIVAGEKGYDGVIAALVQAQPAVIYAALFPAEAILIGREIARKLPGARLLLADTVTAADVATIMRERGDETAGGGVAHLAMRANGAPANLARRTARVVEDVLRAAAADAAIAPRGIAEAVARSIAASSKGDAAMTSFEADEINAGPQGAAGSLAKGG